MDKMGDSMTKKAIFEWLWPPMMETITEQHAAIKQHETSMINAPLVQVDIFNVEPLNVICNLINNVTKIVNIKTKYNPPDTANIRISSISE